MITSKCHLRKRQDSSGQCGPDRTCGGDEGLSMGGALRFWPSRRPIRPPTTRRASARSDSLSARTWNGASRRPCSSHFDPEYALTNGSRAQPGAGGRYYHRLSQARANQPLLLLNTLRRDRLHPRVKARSGWGFVQGALAELGGGAAERARRVNAQKASATRHCSPCCSAACYGGQRSRR
jgi:hypothetical protein